MLPRSRNLLRRHTRNVLLATRPPSSSAFHHIPRRQAQLINSSNSVDARLGIVAPPAPSTAGEKELLGQDKSFTVHPRPGPNPNDLSDLLRGPSNVKRQEKKAVVQSVKGTAIGAHRRGTAIPSTDLDEISLMEAEARQRTANPSAQDEGKQRPVGSGTVDRESPHSIDQMQGRNELDERVLHAARATYVQGNGASLKTLNQQFVTESYKILPVELPYESTPQEERKVSLPRTDINASPSVEEDDGILLLAYVDNIDAPRGQEKISVCTGFGVEGGRALAAEEGGDGGELIVTVAHTLRSSVPTPAVGKENQDKSAALAITRKGLVYPVVQLVSSLPNSDLILLRLSKEPLPVQQQDAIDMSSSSTASTSSASKAIKTLPISPYPAPQHAHLCVSSFWGFEDDSGCAVPRFNFDAPSSSSGSPVAVTDKAKTTTTLTVLPPSTSPPGRSPSQVQSEGDSMSQSRWGEVRLVEYKDGKGSEAHPGTYDSLETLEYKLVQESLINPAVLKGQRATLNAHAAMPVASPGRGAANSAADALEEVRSSHSYIAEHDVTSVTAGKGLAEEGVPNFPPPGSSGGPIVDMSTGAVVGVTRGCSMTSLGGRRGEGVPSEKIFEFFTLPGMGKKQASLASASKSTKSTNQGQSSLSPADLHSQKRSFGTSTRVANQAEAPSAGVPIGQIDRRLSLTFTCAVENCGHRSTHEFSKASYTKGIVLVQCPACQNRHLIADHLSWFTQTAAEPKTVEEMVREKGGRIRTGKKVLDGEGDQGETIEILSDTDWEGGSSK